MVVVVVVDDDAKTRHLKIIGPENPICVRLPMLTCTRLLFESLSNRHAHDIIDTLGNQRAACWK